MTGLALGGSDLWSALEARAAATPHLTVLVDRHGRRVRFSELRDEAATVAAGLAEMGVGAGDVVAWELPTWVEAVVLAVALNRVGAVQVPIIAIYREREVAHCCRQTDARWLITAGEFRGFDFAAMGRSVGGALGLAHLTVAPGSLPRGDPARLAPHAPRPDDARWVFFTSGTTSEPKGARHNDRALAQTGAQMADRMQLGPGSRYALPFPFPHVGGVLLLYGALHSGCTHLLVDVFDPVETTAFLAREGVTHAGTGTPFHLAYLAEQRKDPSRRIFPDLVCCPGGASPKPPTMHETIKRELGGLGIVSSWGLTEAPILTYSTFDDPDDKLATTEGRPLDGVVLRAVRGDGTVAGAGEEGELQVRAPQVMMGYVDTSLDAAAFMDGWFRTGDLGTIDDDGFVRITGRLKDVIIRNGENISAKEVEDLLFAHPAVADVAVIGLPDDRTGERVCAVVCPADGTAPLSLTEVREWLVGRGLRRQAVPEQVEHVDALPRNPAGKVTKQALQDRFAAASRT
ncbi:MAG TPA: AMP-binding protein [Acidimicrobiales bacterium]|nr:AMP-binding protein [Acidimicrobiales bacterium]